MSKTYDVVQESSLPALIEAVNKRLEEGWDLYESHALTASGWTQALTTNKTPQQVKEAAKPKDLTDAEAHAAFLEQANSAANKEAMNQITGPTPVGGGLNEPMQVTVVATPVAEVQAKEKAAAAGVGQDKVKK